MSEQKRFIIGTVVAVGVMAITTTGCLAYRNSHPVEAADYEEEEDPAPVDAECLTKDAIGGEAEEAPKEEEVAITPKPEKTEFVNLQSVVDNWANSSEYGEAAVEIFDLDYGRVAASYRANASMYPRSIYKLFYVYDGYAQIDAGRDDPNASYLDGLSLGQCLDIMVSQSNNPCAEKMLEDEPRLARVGNLIRSLGLTNTQPDGLKSSAHDISLLLQHYYRHSDWSASSWQKFRNSALNQAWTYRKGLPSGFTLATVYNKTGFGQGAGNVYVNNDAAFVEFPALDSNGNSDPSNPNLHARHYIMVVMTNQSSHTILTRLGKMLEQAIVYGN